jgi:hypothetical protein
VVLAGGAASRVPGLSLDPWVSREIFERTGKVVRLEVGLDECLLHAH